MDTSQSHPQWSQLPQDVLEIILECLNTYLHIFILRAVCSSWRCSIPLLSKKKHPLPLTLPFPIAPSTYVPIPFDNSPFTIPQGHFSLSHSIIYILQNLHSTNSTCWIIRLEQTSQGKFRPLNPLSRILTQNTTSCAFPKSFNLLDSRVTEICKVYGLKFIGTGKTPRANTRIKKVVVSSNPWSSDSDDYAFMVIFGGVRLGFIRVGDETWRVFDDVLERCNDVVYHKKRFYAVDSRGKTIMFGSDLVVREIANQLCGRGPGPGSSLSKCLVSSGDNLFMIDKSTTTNTPLTYNIPQYSDDVDLRVFKLNEKSTRWDWVKSIGDQVFFLGHDCSYAVDSKDYPGMKGDCIYFRDFTFDCKNEGLGGYCTDTGVYLMEDRVCGALSGFRQHSLIFWPPPNWLGSTSHGSEN